MSRFAGSCEIGDFSCACEKSQKSQGRRFFAFTCDFSQLLVLLMIYCTYQCKPRGGEGGAGKGWDLTAKSIPSVGGLIEYLCSGVGAFDFFDRETGTKIKCGYMASSFLALKSPVVS